MPNWLTYPVALELDARPDLGEALGYLGYAGQGLGAEMAARLEVAVAKCSAFAPRGVFRVLECARDADGTRGALPEEARFLTGRDIARHVEGASAVALLAVTLGHESERLIRLGTALSATDGMLLDAVASSAAEAAMESLHANVAAWAADRGLHAGGRFSPGYGDLPLSAQPAFLAALDAGRLLGVSATDACLLVPAKSITAVVGLFAGEREDAGVPPAAQTCKICTMAGACLLKRQGRTCHGSRSE